MKSWQEHAHIFPCEGERLLGIATLPHAIDDAGVLIIVGGPQYRAGSHRQFTLLARQLAEDGIASFRFDYRGMGDSEGAARTFESVDRDIRAAIDAFTELQPEIKRVVLWGLCDAASAALMYGASDTRVAGMVLLNPWVHSESAEAKARLRLYYPARIFDASFWRKVFRLEFAFRAAFKEFAGFIRMGARSSHGEGQSFIQRMLEGLESYQGKILILLSGHDDLTVQEFSTLINQNPDWCRACQAPQLSSLTLHGATHTFSSHQWRVQVGAWTSTWIRNQISENISQQHEQS
jgi:uncharacterized protein